VEAFAAADLIERTPRAMMSRKGAWSHPVDAVFFR
jgi:hypothetical protein